MDNSSKIKAVTIVVFASFAALYLGISTATAQFETIAWVLGGTTLFVCLLLGRRIWMLIPLTASMGFTLAIPGSPSAVQVAQILALGFSLLMLLMRKLPFRIRISEIEFWMIILLACVLQSYIRNPAGLNLLGSQSVGARPYAVFALNFAAAILFLGLLVPAKDLKAIFPLTITGGLFGFGLSVIGYFVPSTGAYYGAVHTTGDRQLVEVAEGQATRVGFLGALARNLSLWTSAKISPIRALLHPLWMPIILLTIGAAAGSGFRNIVGLTGLTYLVGIWYRNGIVGLLASTLLGVLSLALLAVVNSIAPFPPNVQRSLTFLPGTWDSRYIDDAEGSTEWRTAMWKEALFTPNWIDNKILGDGLAMSAKEMRWITSLDLNTLTARTREGELTTQQQVMMATGAYHSGPVHTIRVLGYVGLVLVIISMFRIAVHGHRQILRARNTPWYPLALLVGIPTIVSPLFFTFIYGTIDGAFVIILANGSMVRFLENNLPLPAYLPIRTADHLPALRRPREPSS